MLFCCSVEGSPWFAVEQPCLSPQNIPVLFSFRGTFIVYFLVIVSEMLIYCTKMKLGNKLPGHLSTREHTEYLKYYINCSEVLIITYMQYTLI